MAFSNYGDLKAKIADWLNRQDLTDQIPEFVRLFEARVNRVLRTHDMVGRSTALTDDGFFSVPTDWLETISLTDLGGRCAGLEFVSISNLATKRRQLQGHAGPPAFYTHVDGKFMLLPAPTGDIDLELVYRKKIPALAADADSNWLLARSPDLYLNGVLAEAEPYLKNDERVALWQSKANGIIADMIYEAERASYPQGRLTAKPRTFG